MKILMNAGGIAMTNCYVIVDEQTKKAAMFDCPNDTAGALLDEVAKEGVDLVGLYLTHGHFDHVADHAVVTQRFPNAKIAIHRLEEPKLKGEDPTCRMFPLPFNIPARAADVLLNDGDTFKVGNLEFEVLHTPGHAMGHCCFYCAAEQVLIGGDLIIQGSVGRTDLPDSKHSDLEKSIQRVMRLPGETRLLPGHGQASTLADEAAGNPYVRDAIEPG